MKYYKAIATCYTSFTNNFSSAVKNPNKGDGEARDQYVD